MSESLTRTDENRERAPVAAAGFDGLRTWLAHRLCVDALGLDIVLPGGACLPRRGGVALATVRIRDRTTLLHLAWDPETAFATAYTSGRLEVEGELEPLLERISVASRDWPERWWQGWTLFDGSRDRVRESIHQHYDLGNEFYRLWLDRDLVYTCAYFEQPDMSLEAAQTAKLDLVCRKLNLQPGETVVEAGCGWGALALHMAKHYGVHVRAFNISHEQIKYARARAEREGVAHVDFFEQDYRDIDGTCDAFVSVGMLEHVGVAHFAALGDVIGRVLRPDGRGLLHFIGRNQPRPLSKWIRDNVFPGAYPPTLDEVSVGVLRPANLSVLDVENLRLHYALTLAHWLQRYEQHRNEVARQHGDAFVRMWRMYLAGSQAAFATGGMQLFQILFARGETNQVPWTRDWLRTPIAR